MSTTPIYTFFTHVEVKYNKLSKNHLIIFQILNVSTEVLRLRYRFPMCGVKIHCSIIKAYIFFIYYIQYFS